MPTPHSPWRTRGYLPHFDASEQIQHIIFRLADSLPPDHGMKLEQKPIRERRAATEDALDKGVGSRALVDPRVAAIVQDTLLHFDQSRYRLLAWCVMPTHVHVLAHQREPWPLAQVVHAWKSYTANRANRTLGRRGPFWAREYFDRAMRDEAQVARAAAYIEAKPVAAGLCADAADWAWSSAGYERR